MYIVQLGAEGERVEAGELLDEKAALKAAVGGFDLSLAAGEVAIDLLDLFAEGGSAVILPAGITAAHADRAAGILDDGLHALDEHLLLRGDARAHGVGEAEGLIVHAHDAEVERGLHKAGEVGAHLLHALRQRKEHMEEAGRLLRGDGGRDRGGRADERKAAVGDGVFILERRVKLLDEGLERAGFFLGNGDKRIVSKADDIIKLAAGEIAHAQRGAALHRAVERAAHEAVGIAAAVLDVHAGVTALETRNGHAVALIFFAERFARGR